MTIQSCAVIILASGLSRRFGPGNKLLAHLNGQAVVSYVLNYLSGLDFGGRYSVTADAGVAALTADAGYENIHNADQDLGLAHARRLGAKQAMNDGFDGAVIVLGDMPFVSSNHIKALMEKAAFSSRIMSQCGGVLMPPAFFAGQALAELAANAGGQKHSEMDAQAVSCELTADQARDIDTPEDLPP